MALQHTFGRDISTIPSPGSGLALQVISQATVAAPWPARQHSTPNNQRFLTQTYFLINITTCDWVVYGRKVGKTVRMNLAGMKSITRMEVPNITREAQNLKRFFTRITFSYSLLPPPHVPRYAQMNHLLDWVEIWVVEIPVTKFI